jgi:hypothetical protein
MKFLCSIVLCFISWTSLGQNFIYSGYVFNADGSGASNVPVKIYRRTTPNIIGFTQQTNFNGHSYYRSTSSMTWTNARQACINMGGHLVTITSSSENNFVFNTWPSGWIGFTDEGIEGQWRWVTGEPVTFTNWNGGEPNNAGNEDYAQFVSGGRWNDLPNVSLPYVLEFEYIVTTTEWLHISTVYTNSNGLYSINLASDPSKEYHLEIACPYPNQNLNLNDGKMISDIIFSKLPTNGLSFHRFDLNNDGKINVSDQFLLFAMKSGLVSTWAVDRSRIFTANQYNAIVSSKDHVRSIYPGSSVITTNTLISGGVQNFYIISPGYSGKVNF